jgi:hypothetical protein
MYPPGPIMFVRPLKKVGRGAKRVGWRRHPQPEELQRTWDCVWVTPQELISEGILVSNKVCANIWGYSLRGGT